MGFPPLPKGWNLHPKIDETEIRRGIRILHNYGDATIAKLTGFSRFIKVANAI